MLRLLVASLLALTALTALAPNASAVYICGHQFDATDLVVGDDPVAKSHCTTENLVNYDCDAYVTVYQDGNVYRSTRCEPILCTAYCDPYVPLASGSTAAAALPCGTAGSPVLDGGFGATCAYGPASCSAATATYATVEGFLSPDAGCSVPSGQCEFGPQVEGGHVERFLVECEPFIYCFTEPCPGGLKL
jgi:hypothetical protein